MGISDLTSSVSANFPDVRELVSRRVVFGYAVEGAETGDLLATAETTLIALNHQHALARIPEHVLDRLESIPDPVRI